MKATLLLLLVVGLAIDLSAQTPTPTPDYGQPAAFNPFGASRPTTPTPVNRKALSTVPAQSNSAATNRNSSVAVTSPTPRPNNRAVTFANGATVTAEGNNLVVVSGEGKIALPRRAGGGPPSYPPGVPSDCRSVKRWLDTHKANTTRWRITLEMWFEACGF